MTVPFLCVGVAFLLIYLPKIPASIAMARQPEGYDNKHPRDQQARLAGWGRRAAAAHLNGFEAFAPFAAAVLVAHLAGADPRWSSLLALTFVGCRTLYPFLYMANLDKLRSTVWTMGFVCTTGLFALRWIA